eukprot:698265-Karenia_brevis.AAC.1
MEIVKKSPLTTITKSCLLCRMSASLSWAPCAVRLALVIRLWRIVESLMLAEWYTNPWDNGIQTQPDARWTNWWVRIFM